MTTQEKTILVYKELPKTDQKKVSVFVEKLRKKNECKKLGLEPLSKEKIYEKLEAAQKDYRSGRTHTFKELIAEGTRRYGEI